MTKEELEKEAEEKFKQKYEEQGTHLFINRYYTEGYQDGAEPREKRIAELEKENAELKEILNIRSCQNCKRNNKSCPNDGSCKNYSKWKGCENPQLTKAKELIENIIRVTWGEGWNYSLDWKVKAEQFLKEV